MSAQRDAVLAVLPTVVGLTAPDPAYLALVAPSDDPARQAEVARESDCERVAEGVLHLALDCPDGPYTDGTAFPRLYRLAGGNPWAPGGAFRLPSPDAPPQEGDVLVWGDSAAKGANGRPLYPAHVELLTSWEDGAILVTAGGERTASGKETVRTFNRDLIAWDERARHYVDHVTGRPLIGVVDADLLPYPPRATT